MNSTTKQLRETVLQDGHLAVIYLGQAGFAFKDSSGCVVVVDVYLSDVVNRVFGFKRMVPAVIRPEDLDADFYLSTHSHLDHLDTDSLPVVARCKKTFFIGAPDCENVYTEHKIPSERYAVIHQGEKRDFAGFSVRGCFADHGELAPDALGMLLDFQGIRIYHAGDTCYAPDQIKKSICSEIDILIAPINGQFGNLTAHEALELAMILKPKWVIASHFWTFLEHVGEDGKGDPATFLKESKTLLENTGIQPIVMAPGETLIYEKE